MAGRKKSVEAPTEVTQEQVEATPAPKKTTKPSSAEAEAVVQRKARAAAAVAMIFKATEQKPMTSKGGTYPHLPTGALVIDQLIGGLPLADNSGQICPGYPRGRIIEIFGGESSGKTTLALASIVQAQKAGGLVMFLDYEHSIDHIYARSIGVDMEDVVLYSPNTLEEGLKMIYIAIKQKFDLIVVDSVAAMVPKKELEKQLDAAAAIGALARVMSNILPKLTQWLKDAPTLLMLLNQVRSTISTGGGGAPPPDGTAGGKAVKFYAALRLQLTRIRSDVIERPDPVTLKKKKIQYGNLVLVKVVKNKIAGTQGHSGTIFIRYGFGVDEYFSLIEGAIPRKIITQKGSSYSYMGETFRGKDSVRAFLKNNPKALEDVRSKITKSLLEEAPKTVEDAQDDEILSDMTADLEDGDLIENDTEGLEDLESVLEDM